MIGAVDLDPDPPDIDPTASETTPGRFGSLWLHGLLLACVLCVTIPVIGTQGQLNNDEGSALVQARQLRDHGTWFVTNQFPEADPSGRGFALERSTHTDEGFAPLLKHPTYPLLLSVASRFHGRVGIALVGVLGTLVAAIAAALIARELRPRLALWTLWVTGLASPLFFDAFIVIAHSLGAAGVGAAGLGVVRYLRRGGWWNLALVGIGLAWATSLRSEALLLAFALSATLVVSGFVARRAGRNDASRHIAAGIVGGAASLIVFVVDRAAVASLAPTILPSNAEPLPDSGFVADRLNAFMLNWFRFSYNESQVELLGPMLLGAFGLALALLLRRKSSDRVLWTATAVALWTGAASWFAFGDSTLIPGLLPAFPLLIVALVAWNRAVFDDRRIAVLSATFAVFAGLVLATEYSIAGALEWGARYLAVGLPLLTPVVVAVIDLRYRDLPRLVRPLAAVALVPLLIAPALVSTKVLRSNHSEWASVADQVITRARATNPGDGGDPVIVTDDITMPRFVTSTFDQARWLALDDEHLDPVVARMHEIGIDEFLFVTQHRSADLGGDYRTRSCDVIGTARIAYTACVVVRAGD